MPPFLFFGFLRFLDCLLWPITAMVFTTLTFCVCRRFAQVSLPEVLGNTPPRAFRNMERGEREQLFWALKAQTTAQRGVELQRQQAPPVRFGPQRVQTEQPRRGRRARVLSSSERRERLAQDQPGMDTGVGEVRSPPARIIIC